MDVQTYVTLEKAFVARLQKSWKWYSTPIYAKIAAACRNQEWDKAKQFVPELNYSIVGETQREWIKYMLLSFAVFGAYRAANTAPVMHGSPATEEMLARVTNTFLKYLEDDATKQVREQALQLIAKLEKAEVHKKEFKYGNVQVTIPDDSDMAAVLEALRAQIPEDHLAGDGKDIGENHVTVRYGLKDGEDQVREYIVTQGPFDMALGKIHVFEPSESSEGASPIVAEILSDDLYRMHDELGEVGDWIEPTFKDYVPHATIAYVKPEVAEQYKAMLVKASQYKAKSLSISHKDGELEEVELEGPETESKAKAKPLPSHAKVEEDDEEESKDYLKPLVSFANEGDDQLQLIASLNGSRLATWGFTAEAEIRGISRYKLQAVLDNRTSPFCELIDGKEFNVADAASLVNKALAATDPDDLRDIQPWPDQDKESIENFGDYNEQDFLSEGLQIPPFHPNCRTILVPADE